MMLKEMLDWWWRHFWLGLAATVVGLIAISPLLLSKRFRKWFSRSDLDLENLGLLLIVVAIVAIGVYNRLSAGGD